MNELAVMDQTGDTKTVWDPDNEAETEAARATFDTLKKKRYTAYRVGKGGEKAEIMNEFDPQAGKIIMAPPLAGG